MTQYLFVALQKNPTTPWQEALLREDTQSTNIIKLNQPTTGPLHNQKYDFYAIALTTGSVSTIQQFIQETTSIVGSHIANVGGDTPAGSKTSGPGIHIDLLNNTVGNGSVIAKALNMSILEKSEPDDPAAAPSTPPLQALAALRLRAQQKTDSLRTATYGVKTAQTNEQPTVRIVIDQFCPRRPNPAGGETKVQPKKNYTCCVIRIPLEPQEEVDLKNGIFLSQFEQEISNSKIKLKDNIHISAYDHQGVNGEPSCILLYFDQDHIDNHKESDNNLLDAAISAAEKLEGKVKTSIDLVFNRAKDPNGSFFYQANAICLKNAVTEFESPPCSCSMQ